MGFDFTALAPGVSDTALDPSGPSGTGIEFAELIGALLAGQHGNLSLDVLARHAYTQLTGKPDSIPFRTDLPTPPHSEGLSFYDPAEHALVVYNDEPEVKHQLGQEGFIRVFNGTGATIPDGSAVYMAGVEGVEFRPSVALAKANALATAQVLGVSTHSIENNTFGYITTSGLVNNLNTAAFANNDILFLSPTVAGGFVTIEPTGKNLSVVVGFVVRSHATLGRILIRPSAGGLIATSKFLSSHLLFDQPNPFMDTNSATYVAAAQKDFFGTNDLTNLPNQAKMIVSASMNGSTSGYRLFDATNALTIAEVASTATNIAPKILDLGVISNLPATEAIFEIQFKKNTGGSARMSFLGLRKT